MAGDFSYPLAIRSRDHDRRVELVVQYSDLLTLATIITTVITFLAGFASVRVHAHHDRAVARYEALIDRLVEVARTTSSYPRPTEFKEIGLLFDREAKLDPAAILTPVICSLAALLDIGIVLWVGGPKGAYTFTWTPKPVSVLGVAGIAVLVSLLLDIDFLSVAWLLRRDRDAALPKRYELALRRSASLDTKPVAVALFEEVLGTLPRWPWAMLGISAALSDTASSVDLAYSKYLAEEVMVMVKDSHDPIDRALLARAYLLTRRSALAVPITKELTPLSERYPEIRYLLADAFPAIRDGLESFVE